MKHDVAWAVAQLRQQAAAFRDEAERQGKKPGKLAAAYEEAAAYLDAITDPRFNRTWEQ